MKKRDGSNRRTVPILAATLGLGSIANGIFMLVDPANWYFAIPGVINTGAFNQHFIRDIAMIYCFIGLCFVIGARREKYRAVLWSIGTIWLAAHGVFHIWEVAVGICGPGDLLVASPSVLLPPVIGATMSGWAHYARPSVA
jgi:hypothetical protein